MRACGRGPGRRDMLVDGEREWGGTEDGRPNPAGAGDARCPAPVAGLVDKGGPCVGRGDLREVRAHPRG